MTKERASLGFTDEIDSFNPEDWKTKPEKTARRRPEPEVTRKAASETGFTSREAASPAPVPKQRRRRTGRNAQFNIKARPETIDAFCAVADGQGWGLGETLEKAVALLEKEYGAERQGRPRSS